MLRALHDRGVRAEPAVWDDAGVDWAGYDLAVLRSTWDYPQRRDEFVAWARRVPRLANPAGMVEWNTDKRYLAELAASGIPVVPTRWVEDGRADLGTTGEVVIKPTVGAGGLHAGRYDLSDPVQRAHAGVHLDRLGQAMVQPYLRAVDDRGETAMVYFAGRFSHALRKGPLLSGPVAEVDGLFRPEQIDAREPSPAERAVADRVVAALPFATLPVYARIDLLPGENAPVVIEVELTEPSLFLGYSPGAADRFASAISAP